MDSADAQILHLKNELSNVKLYDTFPTLKYQYHHLWIG